MASRVAEGPVARKRRDGGAEGGVVGLHGGDLVGVGGVAFAHVALHEGADVLGLADLPEDGGAVGVGGLGELGDVADGGVVGVADDGDGRACEGV